MEMLGSASGGLLFRLVSVLVFVFVPLTLGQTVNVALNKPITALYTCGTFGSEKYNTLTDADGPISSRSRKICADIRERSDATANITAQKPTHPPSAMVDGNTSTWWQSVSRIKIYDYGKALMAEMDNKLEAVIDTDLLQEFFVEIIYIQLGDALTPQRVSIMKSLDGKIFSNWIFGVANLNMCSMPFGVSPKNLPSTLTDVICKGYIANDVPPGDLITIDITSVPLNLKEWTRVRYLKIKFYDMLFISPFNQMANTFNHYAVQELTIMAKCPCNGQQVGCEIDPITGMYECVCGGNTRGMFCEGCMPMFNQLRFQFGQGCVECNCFKHASSCIYQASVEARNESMDTQGNMRGGGVCLDCQHNTAGVNCEVCANLHYRPAGKDPTAVDTCVACACNTSGSTMNPDTGFIDCVMTDNVQQPDGKVPGDCFCKANVLGSKCDECKQGFYNLDASNEEGCTACACYMPGTIGASVLCASGTTGQCNCKANVEGRGCTQCKDGFYGLTSDNVNGCLPCNCDIGGAVDQVCNKQTGQCVCRNDNILGRGCDGIRSSYYSPSTHYVSEELEDSFGDITWQRSPENAGYSGKGYALGNPEDSFSVLLDVPEGTSFTHQYILLVRYRTSARNPQPPSISVTREADDLSRTVELAMPNCASKWCLVNTENMALFNLSVGPNLISIVVTAGQVFLDKIVALPAEYLTIDPTLAVTLPAGCNLVTNTLPIDPAASSVCKMSIFTITMNYWNSPLQCNCDMTGSLSSECDLFGGLCGCQLNVVDRTCSSCDVGFFGLTSTGCTACNCDAVSTVCDSLTGQCQCPDNTVGKQCEVCLPNHWDWNQIQGCKACGCDTLGSLSQQCNSSTGLCRCKPGSEGDKCDQCQDGYYSVTGVGCTLCNCNTAGSVSQNCNKTSGDCDCKAFVTGVKCDSCTAGTFGLHESNTNGCLGCVCMGITSECQSADVKFIPSLYPLVAPNAAGEVVPVLQLHTENGTLFDTTINLETAADGTISLVANLKTNQPRLFWKLPDEVIPRLLDLYKTSVKFKLTYVIVEGTPLQDLRAVMWLKDNTALTVSLNQISQENETEFSISIEETAWLPSVTGPALSRQQFLKDLALAKSILIPASFSSGNHTTRLSSLTYNTLDETGVVNTQVEQCVCGQEYLGRSCQMCAPGLRRVNVTSSQYLGVCAACECNAHSTLCDPDTGACLNCADNTAGDSCGVCDLGYYGDATVATRTDCTLCACNAPRVKNATCEPVLQIDNSTVVTCSYCQDGYIGTICDQCAPLYYGNPAVVGGTCSPCECNGNSDTCSLITGVCETCTSNTTGDRCDRCALNFYGNASEQTCKACQCVPENSNSTECDTVTGQCPCALGVTGRICDQCQMGFHGLSNSEFKGCRNCGCVEAGSLNLQCNGDTGQCPCKQSTSGAFCDTCIPGFYGLPLVPCQLCSCDTIGTVAGTECDKVTGQCQCKPGVTGTNCDQCLPFFVDLMDTGCKECGLCEKTLGDNIVTLTESANRILGTVYTVLGIQDEDKRLQGLSSQLQVSLESLGLAGKDVTSVTDLVQNVTQVQLALSAQFLVTEGKVNSLSASLEVIRDSSSSQLDRHSTLEQTASLLNGNVTEFQQTLDQNIQLMTVYNTTASQYLNQGGESSVLTLSLAGELSWTEALLVRIQNTENRVQTGQMVQVQSNEVITVETSANALNENVDGQSTKLTEASEGLNMAAFTGSVVENSLEEGLLYKSQAEVLVTAINEILSSSEGKNTELLTTLGNAKISAANTLAIYNGNAATVMTGDDNMPFPFDVPNYLTGETKVESLLTSLPILIEPVKTFIELSETAVVVLENNLIALNSTLETTVTVGVDAVKAIDDYNQVVSDLDSAATQASEANTLMIQVRQDISGPALDTLQIEYTTEKASSEALLQEYMALDYQPQVLQSQLEVAETRLNGEPVAWETVDTQLDAVTVAAQTLNTLIKGNNLLTEIHGSNSKVQAAESKSQSVQDTASSQSDMVDQKTSQLQLIQTQAARVTELNTAVRQKLTNHEASYQTFQTGFSQAKSLRDSSSTISKSISNKIDLLESKLANVETLLSHLRQPVTFDGTLGLQLTNPVAGIPHAFDDMTIEVKKHVTLTNGVIFFVEGSASETELEVGVANNKFFLEFNTGSELVRVDNPAEVCGGCWAKIYASRYTNTGHLTVQLLSNGGSVSTSAVGQNEANTKSMLLTSPIYLGNFPTTVQNNKVSNRVFQGCIGSVTYQSKPFSLWTSILPTGQTTSCCQAPPSLPSPAVTAGASFSGFSHLVLSPPSGLLFGQTISVVLELRTFHTDANVFLVSSADGRTKYYIGLIGGRIIWKITTSGLEYTVESEETYASATWIQITTSIESDALRLTVNVLNSGTGKGMFTLGKPFMDLNPLDAQNLILGADTDPLADGYVASSKNFAGCLRNIQITTTSTTTTLNLKENVQSSASVNTGECYKNIIPGVRFDSSKAYMTLAVADQIAALRTVDITFVTTESKGILLYIHPVEAVRFLYIAIFGGHIILVYRQENMASVITQGQFVSDGQLHTVTVVCTTKRISMTVDGHVFEETLQTLNSGFLTFPTTSLIFVGGVSVGITLQADLPVRTSLVGGITNLALNNIVIGQNKQVDTQGVSGAGIPVPPGIAPAPPITVTPSNTCATPTIPILLPLNEGALLDGSKVIFWSNLVMTETLTRFFSGSFVIEIDFASYKSDGVLLYTANSLVNPTQYVSLYLMNGIINLWVRTTDKTMTVQLLQKYNDGKRHKVNVMRINNFVALNVEERKDYVDSGTDPEKLSAIEIPVTYGVFLAGIGNNNDLFSETPQEFRDQPDKMNFAGSLYGVILKLDPDQVSLQLSSLNRLDFPAVPQSVIYGLSLSGSNSYLGLGVVSFKTTVKLTITFSTTSASGLLLLLYQAVPAKYIAVDLLEQTLRLHLYPSYNGITNPLKLELLSAAGLCDGKLHTLIIELQNRQVTVSFDNGNRSVIKNIPLSHAIVAVTNYEFYIGGLKDATSDLPADVQRSSLQGCVQSVIFDAQGQTSGGTARTYEPTQYYSTSAGVSYSCPA